MVKNLKTNQFFEKIYFIYGPPHFFYSNFENQDFRTMIFYVWPGTSVFIYCVRNSWSFNFGPFGASIVIYFYPQFSKSARLEIPN